MGRGREEGRGEESGANHSKDEERSQRAGRESAMMPERMRRIRPKQRNETFSAREMRRNESLARVNYSATWPLIDWLDCDVSSS